MDEIAEAIDELDNLIHALALPLQNDIHVKALRGALPKLKEKILKAYLGLGGADHWRE